MTAVARMALRSACLGLALGLAACSSGSGLTTGTLLGGSKKEATPPPPESATDRAAHVAATAAKAQRCGYVFDPADVRRSFVANETQQGGAPEVLAKAEKTYDLTVIAMTKTIASDEDFCSDERTAVIKRDLGQVLSGNFSDPAKKPAANVGWWTPPKASEKLNRDDIFNNPNRR